jgi:hypothetical protein
VKWEASGFRLKRVLLSSRKGYDFFFFTLDRDGSVSTLLLIDVTCERDPVLMNIVNLLSVFCSDCTYFIDRPVSKDKHVTLNPISSAFGK